MNSLHVVFLIHFASCFYMTGVIHLIQFTHYPSFIQIKESEFRAFHSRHSTALGLIAGLGMITELGTAVLLLQSDQDWVRLNLLSVLLIWFVTGLWSVPAHRELGARFSRESWNRLLKTNWVRTIVWSIRSGWQETWKD